MCHLQAFISNKKCIISVMSNNTLAAAYSAKTFAEALFQLSEKERALPIIQNQHTYIDEYLSKEELLELAALGKVPH